MKTFPEVFIVTRNGRRASPSNHLDYEDAKIEIFQLKSSLKNWGEPAPNLSSFKILKTKSPHQIL
jgi:hypothetical protein